MTRGQLEVLFNSSQKRENRYLEFLARIHGCKLKRSNARGQSDAMSNAGGNAGSDLSGDMSFEDSVQRFGYNGDPNSVKHLSQEQREELTRKMMADFKKRATFAPIGS